jgi:outer membrane protein assembly factor BamB
MNRKRRLLVFACVSVGLATVAGADRALADLTQWRGPNRDGAVPSFREPAAWPEKLTQRWKVEVGLGYATPLLVAERIYLFTRQGEQETMLALSAADGKQLWKTGYPVQFTMHTAAARHAAGPKSTPVFANGKLYSIGMTGIVTAFDAATGRQLWQKPGSDIVPMYTTHALFASSGSRPRYFPYRRAQPGSPHRV